LDISFANPTAATFFQNWEATLPSTSSDYIPITILLSAPLLHPPTPTPKWDKTDWNTLKMSLNFVQISPPPIIPTNYSLSSWFDRHLTIVSTSLLNNIPKKRLSF